MNGVEVIRARVPSGARAGLRHRFTAFAVYQLLATVAGLRRSYDAVIVTNPALETGLPFAVLAWLRRRPALLCVWDVYPEVGVRMGVFRNAAVISAVRRMEDFCLRRAARVQVLDDAFRADLAAHPVSPAGIVVIPPWLDTAFIRPLPRANAFSAEQGMDDKFVAMYAGNLGMSQGLETVLEAAALLRDDARIRFLLVGDGTYRERLEALAEQMALANVRFAPFQPRARLPEVLATADVALVSLLPDVGGASLPSKAFSALASGRPTVAVTDPSHALWRLVEGCEAGVCVRPGDPTALAAAIAGLAQSPELCRRLGANGRGAAEADYDRHAAARRFETVLAEIVAGAGNGPG
jgi:colanic acid biosynthesis glycosyl transferase WcaI